MPHAQDAIVAPSKLKDYLLSGTHPLGRSKAAFFTALGFRSASWHELERALKELASGHAVESVETTRYGIKYRVPGVLSGPSGRSARVVTVWIMLAGDRAPRFVTAFPEG